ncbi:MAG: hypothetical protein EZS28_028221 [Streblomastix strix]|uniref:Uncharacterized protein n=1 Tax=Streblomastix strix TaxID=222440 RepID=A0A5J4V1L3_9EUKA|nr:MAG: hypothetical protein EZS28_028221 [Streblomastix strix]
MALRLSQDLRLEYHRFRTLRIPRTLDTQDTMIITPICTDNLINHTIVASTNAKQILYVSYDSFLKTSNQKELQIVSRCTEFLSQNSILLLSARSLLCGNAFSFFQ